MKHVRVPDEAAAQERGWQVVSAAFAEREPQQRRAPLRAAVALAAVAVLAAVAFTPPGRAVLTTVRKAIGVEHASPALYSLPGGGRLLVGGWLVNADGSTRRLGDYRESSWSPFGRFVVAARTNALVALEPSGAVRWQIGRPDVRLPRWAGSHTDTRIAYLSSGRLRVVAGDGTGDREAGPAAAAPVAPAWRPGAPFTLAYADTLGRVWVLEPDTRRLLFRTRAEAGPIRVEWSADGGRLLVVSRRTLAVYDAGGRLILSVRGRFADAAFLPRTHRIAVLRAHEVGLLGRRRPLFATSGRLGRLVASPDGRRLLVTWPAADQWLFVPVGGGRLRAVANVARQLGGAFDVDGWTS